MTLQEIGVRTGTDKALHHRYCDFYEEHLPGRDFKGRLLEIGVFEGASLAMWREYYQHAEIVGIDIVDRTKLKVPGTTILQVDATDIASLRELGNFDIIIDDGSHNTADQQLSFFWLFFNQLNKGGTYVIEDTHTSLMPIYVNSRYTTLEFLDKLKIPTTHYRRDPEDADSMTALIREANV